MEEKKANRVYLDGVDEKKMKAIADDISSAINSVFEKHGIDLEKLKEKDGWCCQGHHCVDIYQCVKPFSCPWGFWCPHRFTLL